MCALPLAAVLQRSYEHAKPKECPGFCRICGACRNLAREGRVWRQRGSTTGNWRLLLHAMQVDHDACVFVWV